MTFAVRQPPKSVVHTHTLSQIHNNDCETRRLLVNVIVMITVINHNQMLVACLVQDLIDNKIGQGL